MKTKKIKEGQIGKEGQIDNINLENIKIDLKKGNPELLSKTESDSQKNLYLGMDGKSQEERKKRRGWIRRERNRFINQILGKDRTDDERTDSIQKFMTFYKENWKVTDFKIETFTQSKDEAELKDCKELLDYLKQVLAS
jgi:hypothetical protein